MSRIGRKVMAEVVHELCDMLIESGVVSDSEGVLRWIENVDVGVLEQFVSEAEARLRKKRRKREHVDERYEYSYIT
jgi:hypothetical protein